MKKYKTWEVIKMLSENPKLQFKENDGIYNTYLSTRANTLNNAYLQVDFLTQKEVNGNIQLNSEWVLVQQPVSFMEAIKALNDGNSIYNIRESITHYYKHNYALSDEKRKPINTSEILEGTWYIGEPEE